MNLYKRRLKGCLRRKINEIRVKILLKRNESSNTHTVRTEFRLNQFITLRLIGNTYTSIQISVNDRKFCLYEFSFKEILEILNEKRNYSCMDEACLHLMGTCNAKDFLEDPDTMFWIYCYYIDAWVEYDYDWRLLRVDDAFPILQALYHAGDPKAREVFKIEIVKAFLSGYLPAVYFLMSTSNNINYLDYFEFEEIIWLFEKCLNIVGFHNRSNLKPHIFEFLQEKGFHYSFRNNFKKAIKYLNEALRIYPDDIETLKELGVVYLQKGDYELARALFIYLLDLPKSDDIFTKTYIVEAWRSLGEVYNRLFLFNKAIIACNKAMDIDREHVNT